MTPFTRPNNSNPGVLPRRWNCPLPPIAAARVIASESPVLNTRQQRTHAMHGIALTQGLDDAVVGTCCSPMPVPARSSPWWWPQPWPPCSGQRSAQCGPAAGLPPCCWWYWRAAHCGAPIGGASPRLATACLWGRAFTVGAVATGIIWGVTGLVLMASPSLASFVIIMSIAGMTSAAVPYLAPLPLAFHLYAAGAVLPAALRFLFGGTALYTSIGVLMLVYLVGICAVPLFGRWLREAHRLARNEAIKATELERMTRELAAAHQRAQAETARRLELERGRADLEAEINASSATVVDERTAELRQTLAAMTATRDKLTARWWQDAWRCSRSIPRRA